MFGGGVVKKKADPNCSSQLGGTNGVAYFLSIPQGYNVAERNLKATIGLTSLDLPACEEQPKSDDALDYNDRTDYNPFIGSNSESSYGKEITPEHFVALPMIKI